MTNLSDFYNPARRIESLKPYFFHALNQKIAGLRAKGAEVIRLDVGSPDLPPAPFIVTALVDAAMRDNTHGYAPYGGTLEFKQAAASYYYNRFGVELDPSREVLGLIGSKEGIFNLTQAIINPGDRVLVPNPGYPTYQVSSEIAGAKVYFMPLLEENGFLPDLDAIPEEVIKSARILWINYPNNPTGAVASLDNLKKIIDFGREHGIIIAHDAPYMDVCYDGYQPASILQVEGASEVAIEFNSLSKTYNMAGWRLGIAAGNTELIRHLNLYKTLTDSSSFLPLFSAGLAALTGNQDWLHERNRIYQSRRDLVVQGFREMGFKTTMPQAALYVWAKIPQNRRGSMTFCDDILEKTGVSTTPGIVFGEYGEGFLRISLCTPEVELKKALERVGGYLLQTIK